MFRKDYVYFCVPNCVCLSSSGQCSDSLPVFHKTFKRKKRRKAIGKQKQSNVLRNSLRSLGASREREPGEGCAVWQKMENHRTIIDLTCIDTRSLKWTAAVKLPSILFQSLAVDRTLFAKQTTMTGFYRSNTEQKWSHSAPWLKYCNRPLLLLDAWLFWKDTHWLSFPITHKRQLVWAYCLIPFSRVRILTGQHICAGDRLHRTLCPPNLRHNQKRIYIVVLLLKINVPGKLIQCQSLCEVLSDGLRDLILTVTPCG